MYERKSGSAGRRVYQRQRKSFIFASILCLAVALAIFFGSFLSEAEAKEPECISYKYYANVEIQPGDTLWKLADRYMDDHYDTKEDYLKEVMELNSLCDADAIVSGQYLILPYYSSEYKL